MTKKDYILIAKVLNKSVKTSLISSGSTIVEEKAIKAVISLVRHDFAKVLKQDNPRFDAQKFLEAVGV